MKLLKFSKRGCSPCVSAKVALKDIKEKYNLPVQEYDVEIDDYETEFFNIRGVPTFIILDEFGLKKAEMVGYRNKHELEDFIVSNLNR